MPKIPEEELERVKREVDLGAVARARGVELKPQGGDLVGRCPFHEDHDPSLRITPAKGLWRCMSAACGATGNVIQFVQRFDGVSFRHAYELLKKRRGVHRRARVRAGEESHGAAAAGSDHERCG